MSVPAARPRTPRPVGRRAVALALAALATLGAGTLSACSSDGPTSATGSAAAVALPASGSAIDPGAFKAAIARPGTVVLDVRTPAEFAAGHLPGAVNIDVTAPDFADRIAQLDRSAPYAVYCRSGSRSAVAVQQMTDAGFTDVLHLAGGITAWSGAGGEVVTG